MKSFAAIILASFLAAPAAFASWIAPVSTSICTRDFNPWGQSSHCQCPHATRYESRIGACVQGAPIDLVVDGYIAPVVNLEDDTVAYILTKSDKETYKVVLPLEVRSKFEHADFAALKFRVTGEVIENYDGTPIEQPTIILGKLEIWEMVADLDPVTGEEIVGSK